MRTEAERNLIIPKIVPLLNVRAGFETSQSGFIMFRINVSQIKKINMKLNRFFYIKYEETNYFIRKYH